jgi:hypothetical protein
MELGELLVLTVIVPLSSRVKRIEAMAPGTPQIAALNLSASFKLPLVELDQLQLLPQVKQLRW